MLRGMTGTKKVTSKEWCVRVRANSSITLLWAQVIKREYSYNHFVATVSEPLTEPVNACLVIRDAMIDSQLCFLLLSLSIHIYIYAYIYIDV